MRVCSSVLLVCVFLLGTVLAEEQAVPVEQKGERPEPKGIEERLAFQKTLQEKIKAAEDARQVAKKAWKTATQIRERDGVVDPYPHRESVPTSRSGNSADLKAYLAAKQIYLKANLAAALAKDVAWEDLRKQLAEEFRRLDDARAKATRAYKLAAELRQKFEIIDRDPESETPDVSSHDANPADIKAYLAAKGDYLKAKAESEKLEVRTFHSLGQVKQ